MVSLRDFGNIKVVMQYMIYHISYSMYLNIKLQDVTYSQVHLLEALESPTQVVVV
jgi:hypothetical protein